MNKKYLILGSSLILVMLGFAVLVHALTTTETSANVFDLVAGSDTTIRANVIKPLEDLNITNVIVTNTALDPTLCILYNASDSSASAADILETGTFSGLTCAFNSSHNLAADELYSVGTQGATNQINDYNNTYRFNFSTSRISFIHQAWDSNANDFSFQNYGHVSYEVITSGSQVVLVTPTNGSVITTDFILFNITGVPAAGQDLVNATITIFNSTGIYNETTNLITGTDENATTFNVSFVGAERTLYEWNVLVCDDTITCVQADSNNTFSNTGFTENSQTFNATALETDSQGFTINISFNTGEFTSSTGTLIYGGVSRAVIGSGSNGEFIYKTSFAVPAPDQANSIIWQIGLVDATGTTYSNSTTKTQTLEPIIFNFCNNTLTDAYIDFTFFNETTNEEATNATIVSSWTYGLSTLAVNKTLSYSNTTEFHNFTFCFNPSNRSILNSFNIDYNNVESQQRRFRSVNSLLTSVTTNTKLYLLPTISGLFQKFSAVDTNGNPIALVLATLTRTLGSSTITSAIDFTDSSGFVTMFVNPDVTYDAVFSKTGFTNNVFSFTPSSETRTVIMGGGTGLIGNGTQIGLNTTYSIEPTNSTLINNTDYTFSFSVNSSLTITSMNMNITNSSGDQQLFVSGTNVNIISGNLNTANNSKLVGSFEFSTNTESFSVSRVWIIGNEFVGDYSFFKQFSLFRDYGFKDFWRMLIALSFITGLLIFLSSSELIGTSESKVAVALLGVWVFSIVGWLDTGLAVNSTSSGVNSLAQFSSQYGIAILSTGAGLFFVLRRVFVIR